MHVMYCTECNDIVRISPFVRQCLCGKSQCVSVENVRTEVHGPCEVLLIQNESLFARLKHRDRKHVVCVVLPDKSYARVYPTEEVFPSLSNLVIAKDNAYGLVGLAPKSDCENQKGEHFTTHDRMVIKTDSMTKLHQILKSMRNVK